MEYRYSKYGKKLSGRLNYDPLLLGFEFKDQNDCCLVFVKNGWRLRIKLQTQIPILEKIKEDDPGLFGGRNYISTIPFDSQESFEKRVGKWITV